MKSIVEISVDGDFCASGKNQCWFLTTSGSVIVCRAFKEQAEGKHCKTGRAVRLIIKDGKYMRCAQCIVSEAPIDYEKYYDALMSQILTAQEATDSIGIIGQLGSQAWCAQIRKLISNSN